MKKEQTYASLAEVSFIETDRLFLRRLTVKDAEALYAIASDPRVSLYLLWDPHPSMRYTKGYLKNLMRLYKNNKYYEWGVFLKNSNVLIGTCGFTAFDFISKSAEIGYSFGYTYWGHGYATEAVGAVLDFGFDTLEIERITACYAMENTASATVLSKNGMRFIGEGEDMIIKGQSCHVGIHAVTREEYMSIYETKKLLLTTPI